MIHDLLISWDYIFTSRKKLAKYSSCKIEVSKYQNPDKECTIQIIQTLKNLAECVEFFV